MGAEGCAGGGRDVTILEELENTLEGVKIGLCGGTVTIAVGMECIGFQDIDGVGIGAVGSTFAEFGESGFKVSAGNAFGDVDGARAGVMAASRGESGVEPGWVKLGDAGEELVSDGSNGEGGPNALKCRAEVVIVGGFLGSEAEGIRSWGAVGGHSREWWGRGSGSVGELVSLAIKLLEVALAEEGGATSKSSGWVAAIIVGAKGE